jgi:putative Mn2+ efflux pump MntP
LLSHWEILAIAFGLSMDAFSVSVAVAAAGRTPRQTFRLAWHFGLFQFLMPMIGGLAGKGLSATVDAYDHWIAFAILMAVGGHMIVESFRKDREESVTGDRSRGLSLIILSVATSLDALGVGFTLGLMIEGVGQLVGPCLVIGIVAGAMSFLGVQLGRRLGQLITRGAELLGGTVLVCLAVRFLFA